MTSTRERKERFILSFGKINGQTGNDAVSSCLRTYGLELFPDWAIDEMASDLVRYARSMTHNTIQNRRIYQREMESAK